MVGRGFIQGSISGDRVYAALRGLAIRDNVVVAHGPADKKMQLFLFFFASGGICGILDSTPRQRQRDWAAFVILREAWRCSRKPHG
jgi:hypothetical protein